MKVIYTEKSQLLASRVARHLGCRVAEVKYNTFPDGEQYVRVMDLDDDMVIVASTVDSQSVLQAILMLDACEGKNTTLVLPYMAMQDRISGSTRESQSAHGHLHVLFPKAQIRSLP